MANYRLVSNATFRPFSFEEYVKPYQMYGEAYREIESNIVDLEEKAGKWDKLANEQTDPKTHATYKAYADELRAEADQLSRYGMSPQLRRRASLMRGRYAKEIEPIETQYNKREQLRQEQHQLQVASNGTLRFDNDYGNMSLDTMMDNPNMTYQFVSGEKIYQDVANMMLAAANNQDPELSIEGIEGSPTNKKGTPAFIQAKKRRGYTLEDVEKAINRDPDADPYLLSIRQKVIDSYKNNPAFDEAWADPYIAKGMRTGVLGVDSNMANNPNFSSDLQLDQFAHQVENDNKQLALQKRGQDLNYAVNMRQLAMQEDEAKIKLWSNGLKKDNKGNIVSMTEQELKNNPVYQANLRKEKGDKQSNRSRSWIGKDSYYSITGSPANPVSGKAYTFKDVEKDLAAGKYKIVSSTGKNPWSGRGYERTLPLYYKQTIDNFMVNHDLNPDDFFYIMPSELTVGKQQDIIIVPYTAMESLYLR